VPYLSNPDFVRRREPFEELKTQLGYRSNRTDSNSQYRVSLFGLGGVGKTQIAIAFVYWLRQAHPGVSVFWVHASTTERFQQAYASFAQQFLLADEEDPGQDKLELVKLWLERKSVGRWLLVIDNADDAEIFFRPKNTPSDNLFSSTKPLASYIPECSHVSVLVTTRNKQTGLRLTHQRRPIAVGKMDDDESQQLLSAKLDASTPEDQQKLATRLESLPLALVQAAAFIQANCMKISAYNKLLEESPAEVLDTEFEAPGRDQEVPRAVMQTWKISFEEIKRQNPLAGDLLSFVGLIDCQAIPREFLTHYVKSYHPEPRNTGSIRLTTALGVLKAYSFVTENKSSSLDMHRLVHLSTLRWLEEKAELCFFFGQALQILAEVFPDSNWDENNGRCLAYLPHIPPIIRHWGIQINSDFKRSMASLFFNCAGCLSYYKEFAFAKLFSETALELRISLPGDEDSNGTLQTMARLVWIHIRQGNLESAQKMAQKAYEISQRVSGAESQQSLVSMCDLGAAYTMQDRYEEAEELQIRILETAHKIGGSKMEPATLDSMSDLAAEYLAKKRLEKAEGLQMQVVQLGQDHGLSEEHPKTISDIYLLSRIYFAQNRYEEALPLALRAFKAKRRELGEDDPITMSLMSWLAGIYASLRLGRESVDYGLKGIAAATRRWGEVDPRTLDYMCIVAIRCSAFSQLYRESLELWWEVFRRMKRMPGHHYRGALVVAASVVELQFKSDLGKEALQLGLELFGASREVLGEDDPDTLAMISTIASMYCVADRYEEGLEWALKDVEAQRKLLGENHPQIPWCLFRLSWIQDHLKRHEEALASGKECVALSKRVLGPDHLETLQRMLLLAAMYISEGPKRYGEAYLLMQEVLEAAERTLGPDHECTVLARNFFEIGVSEWETARGVEPPGPTTLATSKDQKVVQETPPQKIGDSHTAQSKESKDAEDPRGTPSDPGTKLSAAPRPEPGEKETTVPGEEDQHIPNTTSNADTEPSPEALGIENEQPTPNVAKAKEADTKPISAAWGTEEKQPTPSSGKKKEQNAELAPAAQNVETEQPLPTTKTTEGTPSSSTQPNSKGDAADTAASPRPRPRLRDSFKIRGWSKKQKEKGV
jgi:tetratricopeptide (TPR) repeat protein